MTTPATLTGITEATEEFGLTPRTLRFWEERGLITSTRIGFSGHRGYTATQMEAIRQTIRLTTAGLSLSEVQTYLTATAAERAELVDAVHRRNIAAMDAATATYSASVLLLDYTRQVADAAREVA